mgnify:CR=1 FL=1
MTHFNLDKELEYIKPLFEQGGPITEEENIYFSNWVKEKATLIQEDKVDEVLIQKLKKIFHPIHSEDSIIGISYLKPYGYSGDFKVIDMVYKNHISANPKFKYWDVTCPHERYQSLT